MKHLRHHSRLLLMAAGFLLIMGSVPAEAQILHFSRTKRVCCLPGVYEYTVFPQLQPVTAFSFEGTTVTSQQSGLTRTITTSHPDGSVSTETWQDGGRRVQTFPLKVVSLRKDHCQIRQVVVALASDGTWSVDMLAEQNPELVSIEERPQHLIHYQNEFHIHIRPLLGKRVVANDALDNVAVPSVARLTVKPFWVRQGTSRQIRYEGRDPRISQNFDAINHVAVDLSYR